MEQEQGKGESEEILKKVSTNGYAGRLKHFIEQWMPLTTNPVVLSWLQGYKLPIIAQPPCHDKPPSFKTINNPVDYNQMKAEIIKLSKLGAVEICKPDPGQFVSSTFLANKPNGQKRFILNLKALNKYISAPHFKMEDARTASKLIQRGNYAATIDLKDAYYLLPINKNHRKFLRFCFDGVLYEFTCLPFGLASAPFVFTKLMKPIIQYLRDRGVPCVNYLDDFLILGSSEVSCTKNVQIVTTLLGTLGLIINTEKSVLTPKTRCKFLGFVFDTNIMSIELPTEKREKILKWIKYFINRSVCTIIKFAQFLGLLTSACPAIKYGWVYTKLFERAKVMALNANNGNYYANMSIPKSVLPDLNWWLNNIGSSKNNLDRDHYDLEICTDASLSGWGAFSLGESAYGWWAPDQSTEHINWLELEAIFLGLKCFARNLTNASILIRTDNTTALAYVNKMGSVKHKKANALAREIWQWCEGKNVWIFATYITSADNWQADEASRVLQSETEWSLDQDVFNKIIHCLGQPDIDLFASLNNYKCERYISWIRDPGSETVDAFTIFWGNILFYAFPPFSQILRVLRKIINDKAEGILVVPYWKSQPWFPLFIEMLVGKLLRFGPSDNLLSCPFSQKKHPLHKNLILVAGKLSGKRLHAEEYRKTQ